MLDPRIYRTGLVAVVLAAFVLAFSLYDQQGPSSTTLAPDAFNGQNAYTTMQSLARQYPSRAPGSTNDNDVASVVAQGLRKYGFIVSTSTFRARTALGTRTLQNVVGVRAGTSSGSVVIVTHRDALTSPSTADLSGTAVMLELANVLSGETQQRSVVLVSTSGSAGASGATELARTLPGPIDAVIVLGDLAGDQTRQPVVVPWSNSQVLAPTMLRNTVAAALSAQTGLAAGQEGLAGQFVHLAFPMTPSEEEPFGAQGTPAVLVSLSDERAPGAAEPTSPARITAMGSAILQTINALDSGPPVPPPSAYLVFDGKVVPAWAIRLFVLALILPVLGATIDGVARVRRRRERALAGGAWVLSSAFPLMLAALAVLGLRLVGLISAAPPGPLGPRAVPLHGSGDAALAILGCLILISYLALRPRLIRLTGVAEQLRPPGAAAALLVILCAAAIAIWVTNPFAALLLVPALHLWLWVVDPDVRLHPLLVVVLVIAGLAPIVLAFLYYVLTLGLGPLDAVWNPVLMLAGGDVGILAALEWSLVAGCAISAVVIALRTARRPVLEELPVTVRGPITYAGPGSLGGTESALRR